MKIFKKTKRLSIFSLSILLCACIFWIELAIMYFFQTSPKISPVLEALLDSTALVLAVYPLLYLFGIAPLIRENQAREKLEQKLRASEERYKSLAETSPDCIKLFDRDRKLVYMNSGGLMEHRLRDLEEAKGCDLLKGILEEDRTKFIGAFEKAKEGQSTTIEIRHTREGSVREACLETMVPVRDADGKIPFVFGVSRDISRLKDLERTRELLIQMLVHDLGNPLSVVSGGLAYLNEKVRGKGQEDLDQVLDLCLKENREIFAMISELLDISKMEEGKMTLKYEKVEAGKLIENVLRDFSVMAESRKIVLRSRIAPAIPLICADVSLVRRVFFNLIGNAFKYSSKGASVEVTAVPQRENKTVLFSVRDEGRGIPPEYHEKVFEKFVQVQDPGANKIAGKGLGLTFCKMAVEAHGGKIWVKSEAEKGTELYFELPVDPPLSK